METLYRFSLRLLVSNIYVSHPIDHMLSLYQYAFVVSLNKTNHSIICFTYNINPDLIKSEPNLALIQVTTESYAFIKSCVCVYVCVCVQGSR